MLKELRAQKNKLKSKNTIKLKVNKMKNLYLSIVCLFFISGVVLSQPALQWSDIINKGTSMNEHLEDIATDAAGNIYVTGKTDSNTATGYSDIATIKYKPDGNKEWEKYFNYKDLADWGNFVTLDPAGFIYVTGYVTTNTNNTDIIVIKYKTDGTFMWQKTLKVTGFTNLGNDAVFPSKPIFYNNHLFVAGGISEAAGSVYKQIALFKITGSGTYTSVIFGALGIRDEPNSITIDGSGNLYVCGFTDVYGRIIKFSNSLGLLWAKTYRDTSRPILKLYNIKFNITGKLLLNGWAGGTPPNVCGIAMQINPADGAVVWYKRYVQPDAISFSPFSMALDNSGNIIYGGYYSNSSGVVKGIVAKYNSSGVFQWSKSLDSISHIRTLTCDPSGNIYPAGTNSSITKIFAKLTPTGSISWHASFPEKEIYKIYLDGSSTLIVCGSHKNSSSNNDMFAAKYYLIPGTSKPTGELIEEPKSFNLGDNYPNPFNPSTSIRFSLPTTGLAVLKVYDISGREVAALVDGNTEAGEYEVNFNASHLASGVYFYKLISGSFTDVKKMILVK